VGFLQVLGGVILVIIGFMILIFAFYIGGLVMNNMVVILIGLILGVALMLYGRNLVRRG